MALKIIPSLSLSVEQQESLAQTSSKSKRRECFLACHQSLAGVEALHLAEAGGRVNLIGEHVDYPDLQFKGAGAAHLFSMGGSVQNSYLVSISTRSDDRFRIWHLDAGEGVEFSIDELREGEGLALSEREAALEMSQRSAPPWAFHALGTLMERDQKIAWTQGLDIVLTSNVPHGAGMSNSAANCVALSLTLQAHDPALGLEDQLSVVAFAREAENSKYVGGHCGWLDQLLIVCSEEGKLSRIDYAGNKVDHFESKISDEWQFAALNTNVPHVLAESDYGVRVKELELGITMLRKALSDESLGSPTLSLASYNTLLKIPGVDPITLPFGTDAGEALDEEQCQELWAKLLADDSCKTLPQHKKLNASQRLTILLRRMRHQKASSLIVTAAGEAASQGAAETFGALLTCEGKSLRMSGDFQITGDNGAQDALLDCGFKAAQLGGLQVYGRMLGGGGGGNVLFMANRQDEAKYQTWISQTQELYAEWAKRLEGEVKATLIEPKISAGAELVF